MAKLKGGKTKLNKDTKIPFIKTRGLKEKMRQKFKRNPPPTQHEDQIPPKKEIQHLKWPIGILAGPKEVRVDVPDSLKEKSAEVTSKILETSEHDESYVSTLLLRFKEAKSVPRVVSRIRQINIDDKFLNVPNVGILENKSLQERIIREGAFPTKSNQLQVRRIFQVPVKFNELNAVKEYYRADYISILDNRSSDPNVRVCSLTYSSEKMAKNVMMKPIMYLNGIRIALREPPLGDSNLEKTRPQVGEQMLAFQ